MDVEMHMVVRLLVAAGLGALVGLEREVADHPAGLRTHLTVALGAALFGVISTLGFEEFRAGQRDVNIQFDVTRVASTVVTGIGFLGAGIIFRQGSTVHNLTTAASLWVVAAIGLACGVGDLAPAVVATAALLLSLVVLNYPRRGLRRHVAKDSDVVRIVLAEGASEQSALTALEDLPGLTVLRRSLEKDDGAYVIEAYVEAAPGVSLRGCVGELTRRDDVRTLRVGSEG